MLEQAQRERKGCDREEADSERTEGEREIEYAIPYEVCALLAFRTIIRTSSYDT